MSNGKGDARRPAAVPDDQIRSEWIRIFGTSRVAPLNPNVARAQMAEELNRRDDSGDESCERCGLSLKFATKCHRASWQKNPGPRRK